MFNSFQFKQMMDQIEKEETYSDSDTAVSPKKTPMKNVEAPVQVDFEAELNNVNNIIVTNNSHALPNKVSRKLQLQFRINALAAVTVLEILHLRKIPLSVEDDPPTGKYRNDSPLFDRSI